MATKNNPGAFDCYQNAGADEPMFVLLARDVSAPELVRAWADQREKQILDGARPATEIAQVQEARECARQMEEWRLLNRS